MKKPRKTEANAPRVATKAPRTSSAAKPRKPARESKKAAGGHRGREGTKQARLIEMLKRSEGVTIEEAASEFGWQPHTVRGAIYWALKTKLGLTIESGKVEGRGRVFRIAG